jgi:glycosyltransferase involved in cell wall biosynthesis
MGDELRVLAVTNMWPVPGAPQFGIFVERQVAALRRAGVDVDVLFVNGRASRLNYLRGFAELRQRVRRQRYDLVHATYVFSGLIARAQLRHPVVLTHTGIEVLESWQAPLSWAVSRVVDAVVVRSEEMHERLGLPTAAVIPSGVDFDVFRPEPRHEAREALGLDPETRIVLFVGEPRPEKRLDVIQGAVEMLRRDDPRVSLIQLCGKPQEELARYLSAADVLALPSNNEGSPGAVKEAMACNLPVVAADVGDVRQVIDGTEGCYLAARTPEDFARKISLVFERGGRTDGRMRIEWLSWPRVTARLLDVYRGVL